MNSLKNKEDDDDELRAFNLLCKLAIVSDDKKKIKEMKTYFKSEPIEVFILRIEGEILKIL